jgi:putative flippase GtrA
VRLARIIPHRHRPLARELVTFGFAGMVNTVFGFALFNLLFGIGTLTANAISTAAATGCSFVLNRFITYRHRPRTPLRRELPMFALVNLVGLGIQQGIMALAKVALDLSGSARLEFNGVRLVATVVGTIFLLVCYRSFVFRVEPAPAPTSPVPVALIVPAERTATTAPVTAAVRSAS